MSAARFRKVISKLVFVALALGILASAGNAQNAFEGKFTLPSETYWGGVTLPAGNYTFTLGSQTSPYTFYIRGEKANAIVMALVSDAGTVSSHAQLDLVEISDVHAVKTFEAPELGVTFTYFTPNEKHTASKELSHKSVPQTESPSQVSDNRMSIAVQTSGR